MDGIIDDEVWIEDETERRKAEFEDAIESVPGVSGKSIQALRDKLFEAVRPQAAALVKTYKTGSQKQVVETDDG